MAGRPFVTVPEEVLEHAELVADWFEQRGYEVSVEPLDPAWPYRPTLLCERAPTKVFVEVAVGVSITRADDWSRFGRSCTSDTRVVMAVPETADRSHAEDSRLSEMGIGLIVAGSGAAREASAPSDLALNVKLPKLETLPRELRPLLGPVYEQFDRTQWREGFEEACQVLQVESATYLCTAISDGRVRVLDSANRLRPLTDDQINRMTLGQLAKAFSNIAIPNHPDTIISTVLAEINDDRNGVAHKKREPPTEEKLRQNVGQHMWRVYSALKAIRGV